MSIIQKITSGEDGIVKDASDGKWLQADYKSENHSAQMQKSEITPEVWYGVLSGHQVKVDGFKTTPSYDFNNNATSTYDSIEEEDVKFLLLEGNQIFKTSLFSGSEDFDKRLRAFVWGLESSTELSGFLAGDVSLAASFLTLGVGGAIQAVSAATTLASTTVGIMGFFSEQSYAQGDIGGTIEEDHWGIVGAFLKKTMEMEMEGDGKYATFLEYWESEISYMKKNFIKTKKDVAEIVEGVQKGDYSLDVFNHKCSIVVSFVLDYGEFSTNFVFEEYYNINESTDKIENRTTGGNDSTVWSESQIAISGDLTEGIALFANKYAKVWTAGEAEKILYPTNNVVHSGRHGDTTTKFSTDNYWLKMVDGYTAEKKTYNIPTELDADDQEIVKFLKSETGLGNSGIGQEVVTPSMANKKESTRVSNRKEGEGSRNLLTYDSNAGIWDKHRELRVSMENTMLTEYVDYCLTIKAGDLPVDADGAINLTKSMDKRAFEIGTILARAIAINKVNMIKATLFVNLEVIEKDKDNAKIEDIIADAAKKIDEGANLGYEQDEISQKEIAERQKLLEQCALLLNLKEIDEAYNLSNFDQHYENAPSNNIHKSGYFGNRFLRMQGNVGSRTVTSLYAQRESAKPFLEINPVLQGLLVPKIKIQKIVQSGDLIQTIDVPFTAITTELNSKTPINYVDMMNKANSVFRGGGVGIKSISFDFDGETPATAQKWVRSTMSLKFQDFADLVNTRKTTMITSNDDAPQKTSFRFLDLIVNSTENTTSDGDHDSFFREFYKPTDYKIKMDVGWNYSKDDATKALIISQGIQNPQDFFDAIDKQNKSFLFAALDHDLNINDDGSVDLNINYFGFPDALLKSYKFNALVTRSEEDELKKELKELLDAIGKGICNQNQLSKLQGAIEERRQQMSKRASQSIQGRLSSYGLLRQVKINDNPQLSTFKKSGAFTRVPTIETSFKENFEKNAGDTKTFFLLGDLLYVLLDCLYDRSGKIIEGAENLSMILTDFEFSQYLKKSDAKDDADNPIDKIQVNLASIPISLDFFKEWFADEITASERYNYPVLDFILVLANRLVGDILTEVCFNKKADKTLFFRQAQMFGSKVQNEDFVYLTNHGGLIAIDGIINTGSDIVRGLLPITYTPSGQGAAHDMHSFVTIYADFKPETHKGKGLYSDDMDQGIYHFHIGAASGLLKKINFSKTNITYLRESRMLRHRGIGDFAQLSNVYNASLELYGNFLFFPGMQIFIDPFGLGGDAFGKPQDKLFNNEVINYAKLMGIGGYHLITSVKTTIGVDGFKTTIEARFFFSGDTEGNDETITGIMSRKQKENDIGAPDTATNTAACNKILSTFETKTIKGAE